MDSLGHFPNVPTTALRSDIGLSVNSATRRRIRRNVHIQRSSTGDLVQFFISPPPPCAPGPLLFATRGYGAPETMQASQRASELAEKTGNVAQFIGLVISRGISAFSSGELRTASELADQALELARRESQAASLGFIHM